MFSFAPSIIRRPAMVIALALTATLALTSSVEAQPGSRGGGRGGMMGGGRMGGMTARVTAADINSMEDVLSLDEDQLEIIDTFYDQYRDDQRESQTARQERMRAIIDEARESGDFTSIRERMTEAVGQIREESETRKTAFFEEAKSVLTKEQLAQWPRFEREHRRHSSLSQSGGLSGENVDLIAVTRDLASDDETLVVNDVLEGQFETYARIIDPLIVDRDIIVNKMMDGAFGNTEDTPSPEDMERNFERLIRARKAVMETNDQYVVIFAGQLDQAPAAALRKAHRRASFPRIFRATQVDRYADRLLQQESLSEEQIQAVTFIVQNYEHQSEGVNTSLADQQRRRDEDDLWRRFSGIQAMRNMTERPSREERREMMQSMMGGGGENEQRLYQERTEMVRASVDQLFAVLTPDQQAELPKPEVNDPSDWGARRQEWMQNRGQRRGRGGGEGGEGNTDRQRGPRRDRNNTGNDGN